MEMEEYRNMARLEESLWWYRALHEWTFSKLNETQWRGSRLLDAGSGSGGFLRFLEKRRCAADPIGLEIHSEALTSAKTKTSSPLIQGTTNQLPLQSNSIDFLLCIDVLYHKKVDDQKSLKEFARCLKPQGALILHVPAYQWLRSYHDRSVHAKQRYTSRQLQRALAAAGFVDISSGYRLGLLFPAVILRRTFLNRPGSDVERIPHLLNNMLYHITRIEDMLSSKGLSIPFGSSTWATARKP